MTRVSKPRGGMTLHGGDNKSWSSKNDPSSCMADTRSCLLIGVSDQWDSKDVMTPASGGVQSYCICHACGGSKHVSPQSRKEV